MKLQCVVLTALLALAACAQRSTPITPPVALQNLAAPAASKIRHVVIIFQENRTVDNLFNGLPGAQTVASGRNSKGQMIPLRPVSLSASYDLGHTHGSFQVERNNGKWNGFDRVGSRCLSVVWCAPKDLRAYGFVPHDESAPYFAMAMRYAFADHMFQTNQGPSFPAHQYIISGTSSVAEGARLLAAENPFSPLGQPSGGCDSPDEALVALIDPSGNERHTTYPCFDRNTLMDLVAKKSLTWRYYQAYIGPGIWNGPDAILHIRAHRSLYANVVAPSSTILTDVADGKLANVSWVTPTAAASDHAADTDGSGPSWVAAVVNAIGESPYWNSTAIFVTWDDWGGWYDHVAPPVYNAYELSFRVPLIVISPYSRNHYVSHRQHEFGSILRFAEQIFGLGSLHTTDTRADDLFDSFDFSKKPTKFKHIPAPLPPRYFMHQSSSQQDPDDDR